MNKYQRRESKTVHKMIKNYPILFPMDENYKIVRRNVRKTVRLLMQTNQKTHKKVLSNAEKNYIRHDLFNTICITQTIEVKNE